MSDKSQCSPATIAAVLIFFVATIVFMVLWLASRANCSQVTACPAGQECTAPGACCPLGQQCMNAQGGCPSGQQCMSPGSCCPSGQKCQTPGDQAVPLTDHFQLNTSTINSTNPLGTGVNRPTAGSNLGGSINSTRYTFPDNVQSGQFVFVYVVGGSSSPVCQPGAKNVVVSLGSNLNGANLMLGSKVYQFSNQPGTTNQFVFGFVTLNGRSDPSQSYIEFGGGPTFANLSNRSADLFISQINPNLKPIGAIPNLMRGAPAPWF